MIPINFLVYSKEFEPALVRSLIVVITGVLALVFVHSNTKQHIKSLNSFSQVPAGFFMYIFYIRVFGKQESVKGIKCDFYEELLYKAIMIKLTVKHLFYILSSAS